MYIFCYWSHSSSVPHFFSSDAEVNMIHDMSTSSATRLMRSGSDSLMPLWPAAPRPPVNPLSEIISSCRRPSPSAGVCGGATASREARGRWRETRVARSREPAGFCRLLVVFLLGLNEGKMSIILSERRAAQVPREINLVKKGKGEKKKTKKNKRLTWMYSSRKPDNIHL